LSNKSYSDIQNEERDKEITILKTGTKIIKKMEATEVKLNPFEQSRSKSVRPREGNYDQVPIFKQKRDSSQRSFGIGSSSRAYLSSICHLDDVSG